MTICMSKKLAYEVLGLSSDNATEEEIRTQYRFFALKYHPDKNRDETAVSKFHEIQAAYEYLNKCSEYDSLLDWEDDEPGAPDYKTMIGTFISNMFFNNEPTTNIKTEMCRLIISKILSLCENSAISYIEKIDKSVLCKIYEILLKYRDAFHISDAIMCKIEEVLLKPETECILLNPFLKDLVEDNVFKITENGQTFLVPLWHHELVYDNSGIEFIVRCCPVLPEHMEIDENNDIYVYLYYRLSELWGKDTIPIEFGNKTVSFKPSQLLLTETPQQIRLCQAGILHVHPTDMFDDSLRKDVILVIQITSL